MSEERLKGFPPFHGDEAAQMLIGFHQHETVNSASADAVPTMQNCRAIYCDVDGLIKIDYNDDFGNPHTETLAMVGGTERQFRNVTKVYRYRTGTTACTAQVYLDDGSAAVVGLKVRR